ncbi:MAG: HAMP domain-containing histidine kinase [Deltaproteobacteria bacterium]|nr:HAMP domain-containing histidine kinase [Deltaproteobacteria bacterium]
MEGSSRAVYVAYFFLALVLQFVWLGSRFPFALPYYTAMNAFAYIAGPAVVTLEYAQRLISYPALAWLARRGWMSLPPPLEPVLGNAEPGQRLQAWIDHGTAGTLAAFGVLLRYGIFVWLQSSFELGLIPAIAVAEFATLALLGALHAMMPLPMTEALRLGGVLRWRLDDERVDLVVVVILVAPLFVFVINLAWVMEGLPAAIGFSLATFGPHLLMKLSNDRLGRVEGLLESKQQELKDLVHTVAHDLKSPISSALLTTDLVLDRDGGSLGAEAREDLGRVVRLLSRAEDMVRDLLRLFRIVWEPERRTEVDLDQTIAGVLEAIQPKAAARGARIITAPLPRILGQAVKLEHAFSNLLENAVKHLPASGGVIAVEARIESTVATICVRDNGCGIPSDYHHRIFELYSRVPRPSDPQSSGVGLAIVKRVVEAHGGRVWVESEAECGSRFYMQLPMIISSLRDNAPDAPAAS